MNKKYKVEIIEKNTYCVDILAENEKKAVELAKKKHKKNIEKGVCHYTEIGDPEVEYITYDVSNTNDPWSGDDEGEEDNEDGADDRLCGNCGRRATYFMGEGFSRCDRCVDL